MQLHILTDSTREEGADLSNLKPISCKKNKKESNSVINIDLWSSLFPPNLE